MRYCVINETDVPQEIAGHEDVLFHGRVFNSKDCKEKDHSFMDDLFRKESEYKVVAFQVVEEQLTPWLREYIEGNGVTYTRSKTVKDLSKEWGLETKEETVEEVKEVKAIKDVREVIKMPYNELRALAKKQGHKVGNMKGDDLRELMSTEAVRYV